MLSYFICVRLCDPMDCSPPVSSVHGILQMRLLEWVAMPSSRGFSWPKDQTCVSWIAGVFFTCWAPWEARYISIGIDIYEEIYYGNWLMWLWRLRKTTVCCLKAGNPGNLVIQFSVQVWRPKIQGSWWYYILVWVWRPKNWKCWCPRAEDECLISGKESEVPLPLLFCSIKALNRLDDAHLHWGAQSSLLSLPTQMLISSRNTS